MLFCRIFGGHSLVFPFAASGHPIGVDPGVELHASLMRGFHPVFQRVKTVFRRFSLCSGKIPAPRIIFRFVESIRRRTHLQKDSVHSHSFGIVQYFIGLLTESLLICGHRFRIVQRIHGGYPDAPHFAVPLRGAVFGIDSGKKRSQNRITDKDHQNHDSRYGNHSLSFLLICFVALFFCHIPFPSEPLCRSHTLQAHLPEFFFELNFPFVFSCMADGSSWVNLRKTASASDRSRSAGTPPAPSGPS